MLEASLKGLLLVLQWPAIGLLFLGILLGVWLGAVPGLGGILGLIVLLPFTYGMDPVAAFALLLGMYAVTVTGDTISAVMIGVPGTASGAATVLDGYALAKKGQAGRALGAAYTSSAVGGVFGALVLGLSLPLIRPIIFAFGSPEVFMLGLLGLAMVSTLSGTSPLKGLTVAVLGLGLTTIGYGEIRAVPRYWFELDYLLDGLPIFPVVFGLFAVPEVMELAIRNVSISRVTKEKVVAGGIIDGIRDVGRHWWLVLRGSMIGAYIGFLPGVGGPVADWVAYGHAVQSAKDKSLFGKGDIRGVICPEASNNADRGGELIPMVAFGIPGGLGSAILMSALIIQGLKPGPDMLTLNAHITFSLVWTLVIANVVCAVLLMFLSNQVVKLAFVPGHLIVPGVVVTVFLGTWLTGASMGDWISCLVMGVLGFFMKRGGWPRPPIILAMVLGDILEGSLHLSMRAYRGFGWMTRPIVLVIAALIVVSFVYSIIGFVKAKRSNSSQSAGEGAEKNSVLSFPLALVLVPLFAWAGSEALHWDRFMRQFPLFVGFTGTFLALLVLFSDTRELRRELKSAGGLRHAVRTASEKGDLSKALPFFGYLIAVILITLVLGQKVVLPLFVGFYLRRWGRYSWRVTLIYALCTWGFMVGFYDRLLHMMWYESWLWEWLPNVLPEWLPSWLFV